MREKAAFRDAMASLFTRFTTITSARAGLSVMVDPSLMFLPHPGFENAVYP